MKQNINSNYQQKNNSIDIVYLWVDGNDPEWINKKRKIDGVLHDNSEANCIGRYKNNNELKYALRSIEQNASWIRNIYIVTDNQQPDWLNIDHPQIKIINHTDIIPEEFLPCFNAIVIEHFLYRIPNLSEKFIYSNDDMFIFKPVKPSFFFDIEGKPIVRAVYNPVDYLILKIREYQKKDSNIYKKSIRNAALLVKRETGKTFRAIPHHNIDGYLKSEMKNIFENIFYNDIISTAINHVRKSNDIQRIIYAYYMLASKKATLKYVKRCESCRIRIYKANFLHSIHKHDPYLFCLNDTQHVNDSDRAKIEPFLQILFPNKSKYEI